MEDCRHTQIIGIGSNYILEQTKGIIFYFHAKSMRKEEIECSRVKVVHGHISKLNKAFVLHVHTYLLDFKLMT